MTEQVGARPLRSAPVSTPLDSAALDLRRQQADPAALDPLQRLRLANTLAIGHLVGSAKATLSNPGEAFAEIVHGFGQMATQPGTMITAAQQTWRQDKREGAILAGRLTAGYIGMAGMAIGGTVLLGRLGAGAARLPNLAFALQKTGQVAFRSAGIAGTAAVGLDAGALAIHQLDAAKATTKQDLQTAVQRLHGDMVNLAGNGVTTGMAKAGGAGMKALATHLRQQELASSLAATNRAVRHARQSQTSLSAQQMAQVKRHGAVGADLATELQAIVGRRVKHLSAADRVHLAEYLNQSLSQAEQAAAGKAIATKLQPGASIDDLIGAGEQAAWEASGVAAGTLQGLKKQGWHGKGLQGVRETLRGAELREGQLPAAMKRTAERLLQADKHTGANTGRLQTAVVRQALTDSLGELGVTRSLDRISMADLKALNHQLHGADPRTRQRLVGLLNETKGTLHADAFWLKAYEHLYADLGVDPAIYRSLAPKAASLSGLTAMERVYNQLKMLPEASRKRVSQAVAAVELKPGDASRVMKQAHVNEMTASIRASLPRGEQAKAGTIATALVKELLEGETVRTRDLIGRGAKDLPGQLLRGNVKAIPAFARMVGHSKAQTESLVASVTSAISKLPESTRQQLFRNLHPDRPIGTQLTNRLTKLLRQDFDVEIKRTQTGPQVHPELVVADMDAAGALNLYNALEAMSGTDKSLPKLAKQGVFARTATHDFGGVALDGDDGRKYTALTDRGLVDNAWNDPAGTTHGEGIWVHEVGHQMQATGVTTAERLRIADWSKLGDWKHGTGKVADGTHPYKRTDNAIYKDPTVGGNTRESVSGYGKTDPAEDWAEFVRIGTADPVAALQTSPPKFLYFATQMAPGWANRLKAWATEAGVDLQAARQEAARRLGDGHPALTRIDRLMTGLPD